MARAKQRQGAERAPIAAFVEVDVGCSPAKVELNVVRGVQLPCARRIMHSQRGGASQANAGAACTRSSAERSPQRLDLKVSIGLLVHTSKMG